MVSRPCVIPSVFPAAYPAIGGVRGRAPLDPDAAAFIAATGATDVANINAWVLGLKSQGIWNNIVCWPMRSTQNHGSGTVLRSLGGLGSFNGTLTNGPSWTTTGISFDGANDFIEIPNPQQSTALSAFSIWSVFDSNQTNGRLLFGSYNLTGASVGPTMWAGNSPLLGGSATDLRIDLTVSGSSASVGSGLVNGNTGNWQTGFVGWSGAEVGISANGGTRGVTARTPSTIWNNNTTWRMGARISNASYFIGDQAMNLYANIYLTPTQAVNLRNLYVSTLGAGLGLP